MPIDPVTAVFNFLCTPAGQVVALTLQGLVTDLVKVVHSKNPLPVIIPPVSGTVVA